MLDALAGTPWFCFMMIKESDTFGIRTMCLSGATRLPADCCFSDITDIISLNVTCSRHDIAEKCSFDVKEQ
jgi:hypothetical protein